LNHALHLAAVCQIRQPHSDGHAYFDRKVTEGKTKKEALRSLKRQISNAVSTRPHPGRGDRRHDRLRHRRTCRPAPPTRGRLMANKKGRRRRFGSVRQLPSGRYQVRYRGPDGLMRPADRTFDTETDAKVWLTMTEAELLRGEWVDPDAGRVPLGDYAPEWIAQRPRLAPRTVGLYESLLRLHIEPTLGSLHLATLTPARVRSWRAALLDAGVGAVTVAKAYRLLRAVMATAVDDELIRRNPCRIKGAGREKSPERAVVGIEDVYTLADAIAPRWRALVLLAAFGGLRWGELAALRRNRVDLGAGTVRVEVSVIDIEGHLSEGPPKWDSRRTVTLPGPIVDELREHLARFSERAGTGRVFVGPKGGTLRRSNFQATWREATKAADVPTLRFHDLRHVGNTLASNTGANLRELMTRMGHASPQAALIYQHATAERDRAIADALGT
jgi:integrase